MEQLQWQDYNCQYLLKHTPIEINTVDLLVNMWPYQYRGERERGGREGEGKGEGEREEREIVK